MYIAVFFDELLLVTKSKEHDFTCFSPENMKDSDGSTDICTSCTRAVLFSIWKQTGRDSRTLPKGGISTSIRRQHRAEKRGYAFIRLVALHRNIFIHLFLSYNKFWQNGLHQKIKGTGQLTKHWHSLYSSGFKNDSCSGSFYCPPNTPPPPPHPDAPKDSLLILGLFSDVFWR